MPDLTSPAPGARADRNPLRQESEQEHKSLQRRGTLLKWLASPFLALAILLVLYSIGSSIDAYVQSEGMEAYENASEIETWVSQDKSAADLSGCLAGLLTIVWAFIYKRGKRYQAVSAEEAREKDPRPPVIYLRSFKDDKRAGRPLGLLRVSNFRMAIHWFAAWSESYHSFDGSSEEEVLADVVRGIGPMIAIGRPGEKLPQLGAARVYVSNEEWQQRVHEFLDKASLVVLRLGETEGFWWEIEQSAKKLDPRRLVLLAPLGQEEYEKFRTRAAKYFPRGLPAYHCAHLRRLFGARLLGWIRGLIYFKPDWTPVYVDLWSVKLPLKYKLRFLGRRKVVNVYDLALQPVYEQLGVKWEPPRYRAGALIFNFALLAWILFTIIFTGMTART